MSYEITTFICDYKQKGFRYFCNIVNPISMICVVSVIVKQFQCMFAKVIEKPENATEFLMILHRRRFTTYQIRA